MNRYPRIEAKIIWSTELPNGTSGTSIVIDVLAATTNMMDFFERGANVFLTNRSQIIQHYDELCSEGREVFLVGEADAETLKQLNSRGLKFAASNSPIHIRAQGFLNHLDGTTLLYLSNNGTRVIHRAFSCGSERVITANFLNIYNVAELTLQRCFGEQISIVPSGEIQFAGEYLDGEDMYCALALKALLDSDLPDLRELRSKAKGYIVDKYRSHGLSIAELTEHSRLALTRPRVLEATQRKGGLIELIGCDPA